MPVLLRYQTVQGKIPFSDWVTQLRDRMAVLQVRMRLRRLEMGNPGDCMPVGEGVSEMRIDLGPGYRIYFGQAGNQLVLLLCGGDKRSQASDIAQAKLMWKDWKERCDEKIPCFDIPSRSGS